jgi:hypothetical protein
MLSMGYHGRNSTRLSSLEMRYFLNIHAGRNPKAGQVVPSPERYLELFCDRGASIGWII